MPNFTIRRRRKKVEDPKPTPEPVETKVDETEEYMSESSDSAAIDQAMSDLKVTPLQKQQRQPQYQPREAQPVQHKQYYRPQYQKPANIVRQQPKPASYPNRNPTRPHIPNQYQRKPTMAIHNPRSKSKRGGSSMRYSTHYGYGGEHLDTRTKSVLLYNHCLGNANDMEIT